MHPYNVDISNMQCLQLLFLDQQNFAKEFATGYLLGEVLYKHGLQDDFPSFSQST